MLIKPNGVDETNLGKEDKKWNKVYATRISDGTFSLYADGKVTPSLSDVSPYPRANYLNYWENNGTTITAPDHGYFTATVWGGYYILLQNTTKGYMNCASPCAPQVNSSNAATTFLPVSKGDAVRVYYTGTLKNLRFYYAGAGI